MMMMNLLYKYYSPLFAPEDGGIGSASGAGAASTSPPGSSGAPPPSTPSTTPSPPSTPSGGTTSPQTTLPSATPAPSSSPSEGGEGFDYSSIFSEAPPELPLALVPPVAPATPPATPSPAPPVPVTAVPPVAVPPATAPGTPVEATPPATAPVEPELDRYNPAQLAQRLASNEATVLDYLAQNMFRLAPEEIEALESNAADTVPKLLARVFVKSQQNMLSQLAAIVPMMIQRQTVAMRQNDENVNRFYAKWPMISKELHGDLVNKYGAVYRQMHPNAKLEQMIEDLGPMIMMAARISPQVQAPVVPTTVPQNPAAARTSNGRAPPPTPFVPAGSAAPVSTSTAPEISPWEAIFRQD